MQRDILEKEIEMVKLYLVDDIRRLRAELCITRGDYTIDTPISVLIDVHRALRREQQNGYQNLDSSENNRGR